MSLISIVGPSDLPDVFIRRCSGGALGGGGVVYVRGREALPRPWCRSGPNSSRKTPASAPGCRRARASMPMTMMLPDDEAEDGVAPARPDRA